MWKLTRTLCVIYTAAATTLTQFQTDVPIKTVLVLGPKVNGERGRSVKHMGQTIHHNFRHTEHVKIQVKC